MERIKLKEAVIVEGKYDKIKLSSLLDATIIPTGGFQIFSDKEQMALIRRLAKECGLLVLTDSDGAGFLIRNYLTGAIPAQQIRHAYIPDILGKEKRKNRPSKEGKLGVEGMSREILMEALQRAGIRPENDTTGSEQRRPITKIDLFEDGLTGGEGSADKRKKLLKELGLPERMTTNTLVRVLNDMLDYEDYRRVLDRLT